MTIPILPGLAALAADYDGYILDVWGVMHQGGPAYPEALACVGQLRAAGKRVVFLSNAPRLAWQVERYRAACAEIETEGGAIPVKMAASSAVLRCDPGAAFDTEVRIDAGDLKPYVSWGTNPGQTAAVTDQVPHPEEFDDPLERDSTVRALAYMDLEPGTPITEITIDRVFLGSCTNARIEDLRDAAAVVRGKRVHPSVSAMVVPGSGLVKLQAEREGLDAVFVEAGFEWRDAGCSMCLGMNPDILRPGQRCVSTSNRNFEGRQGKGGRTHLVSPVMAAAAAIEGHLVDVRQYELERTPSSNPT